MVGGPPLIYMLIFKMDIKEIARFNKIRPGEAFFVIGMAVLGYGVMIIVNLIWYWIVSHIGTPIGQRTAACYKFKPAFDGSVYYWFGAGPCRRIFIQRPNFKGL